MSRYDVVIAGGSFVGLALGLALTRSSGGGLKVAVIDRTPLAEARAAGLDGRASALSAASCRLLRSLDVWDAVAGKTQPIENIEITDSQLENFVRPGLLHFEGEIAEGEPAAVMLENHLLRDALIERAQENDSLEFLAPQSVKSFFSDTGSVSVELDSGDTLETSLLVAADGRRSALRKQAGIKTIGWSYPQSGIVATLGIERPHEGLAIQHFLPQGPFAILPLHGDRVSLVWTEERGHARELTALADEAFLAEARKRIGGRFGALTIAGPRGVFPLDMHIARAFAANRFALAGDAAHGVHPLAGQGLNIGLRDVAALAEVVVDAARIGLDPGSAQVLEKYSRWRRFDSAFSGLAMDALNRLFTNDSVPLRAIRSIGLGLVERAPLAKRFFVREAAGLTGTVPKLLKGEVL